MTPIHFQESNFVFKRPAGMTEEQCGDLPVFQYRNNEGIPVIISCWKPSDKELEEINKTGEVWVYVTGTVTPPIAVDGFCPFIKEICDVQP